jgi:Holliday junction resolvasome RuvABC endonuclease subunit
MDTTTVMTDKQFALHQAVQVYLQHYKKGSFGIDALFKKHDGQSVPDASQVEGVMKLAHIFEQHLNK